MKPTSMRGLTLFYYGVACGESLRAGGGLPIPSHLSCHLSEFPTVNERGLPPYAFGLRTSPTLVSVQSTWPFWRLLEGNWKVFHRNSVILLGDFSAYLGSDCIILQSEPKWGFILNIMFKPKQLAFGHMFGHQDKEQG